MKQRHGLKDQQIGLPGALQLRRQCCLERRWSNKAALKYQYVPSTLRRHEGGVLLLWDMKAGITQVLQQVGARNSMST